MGIFSKLFGSREPKPEPRQPAPTLDASGYEVADVFRGLRGQVLGLANDSSFASGDGPAAVLMETGYPGAVVSLVAIADGTTSMYFSNGGGMIGLGAHEAVRSASARFLAAASAASAQMEPADQTPLPSLGRVRFYLVAAGGTRTAEAAEDDLGNHRHALSPLFHLGHAVLTAIREHAPQQG